MLVSVGLDTAVHEPTPVSVWPVVLIVSADSPLLNVPLTDPETDDLHVGTTILSTVQLSDIVIGVKPETVSRAPSACRSPSS